MTSFADKFIPPSIGKPGQPEDPRSVESSDSFLSFIDRLKSKVGNEAGNKGYDDALLELTGAEHATGEIIYKAVRFRSKGDPDDMIKAAAWAYLLWRRAVKEEVKERNGE